MIDVKARGDLFRVFQPFDDELFRRWRLTTEKNTRIQMAFMVPSRNRNIEVERPDILNRSPKHDVVIGHANRIGIF